MSIRPGLDALFEAISRLDPALALQLVAGLEREVVATTLSTVPGGVAAEVHEYFQWRNGLRPDREREEELFPGGVMLSLDEALADYGRLIGVAHQVARQAGVPASSIWNERWVPLFRHSAGGAYHVTMAGEGGRSTAPVFAVSQDDPGAAWLAYDSLTALVCTVTECFTTGAYVAIDGVVREDPLRAAAIIRAQNPVRIGAASS